MMATVVPQRNDRVGSRPSSSDNDEDITRKWIRQLKEKEGNNVCADCGAEDPDWASVNFGVFLCINCAGIHRGMSISKVRSVRLDSWSPDMIKSMQEIGNVKAKEKYEAKVPACWVPPKPHSKSVCLEQWIRAKYERKEFASESDMSKTPYTSGIRQGFLFKRKRQSDDYNSRWFVLSGDYLSYFKSYQDRNPKESIPLTHLNATLEVPGMENKSNAMLIAYHNRKARKTRNIFVYANDGKEIMDWYCAIRAAKIKLVKETFPERSEKLIRQKATRDFVQYGYLCKTPPDLSRWQKRFFVLDHNSLRYYLNPLDPFALGEVILLSRSEGFYVDEVLPPKFKDTMFAFMLHTPKRGNGGFPLYAENEASKRAWMEAMQRVIESSVEPADQSVATSTYEEDEDIYATIQ